MKSTTTRIAVVIDQGGKRQYLTPRKATGTGHEKRAGWSTDLGDAALFTEKRFASLAARTTGQSGWTWAEITETRKEDQ